MAQSHPNLQRNELEFSNSSQTKLPFGHSVQTIMEATGQLNQEEITKEVGDMMDTCCPKDYHAFQWRSVMRNGERVEKTKMASVFIPLLIEGESIRTGRRPFYLQRTCKKQETYVCRSALKPILVHDSARMKGEHSRTPMARPSVRCNCQARIKVRYQTREDVGAVGPNVEVTVFYNKNHNQACRDLFNLVDGVMLSEEARDTLDALILSSENDSNLTILSKFYKMFVLRAMQMNSALKNADDVYKMWEKNPDVMPRNLRACGADVKNARKRVALMLYQRATDDAVSVQLWTQHNQNETIFYQPQVVESSQPFVLIFFTLDMEEKLRSLGNKRTLLMDATFGTNTWRYPLTTFMAIDEEGKGYPVAWALHSGEDKNTYLLILDKLAERMGPEFCPSVLLIDDSCAEIAAFQSSIWRQRGTIVALCIWHVKRSWLKKMIAVVPEKETREGMMRELSAAIYAPSLHEAELLVLSFCARRELTEPLFVEYFRKNWDGARIPMWMLVGRLSEFNDQLITTTSALERYHGIIKENDLSQKKRLKGRRIDWLLLVLMDKVAVRYAVRRVVALGHKWLLDRYQELSTQKNTPECEFSDEDDDMSSNIEQVTTLFEEVFGTLPLVAENAVAVTGSEQEFMAAASSSVTPCDLCPIKVRDDIIGNEVGLIPMQSEIASLNSAFAILLESVTRAGSVMVARQATLAIQRAIAASNLGETRSSEPFRPLPGDNSLKRKDPAILGGLSKKRKLSRQSGATSSVIPLPHVPKFVANKKPGKMGKGRSLLHQLQASNNHPVSVSMLTLAMPTFELASRASVTLLSTDVIAKEARTKRKRHPVGEPGVRTEVPNYNGNSNSRNEDEDNKCGLCGVLRGFGQICCICRRLVCSDCLPVRINVPIVEMLAGEIPTRDGFCCIACFEKSQ